MALNFEPTAIAKTSPLRVKSRKDVAEIKAALTRVCEQQLRDLEKENKLAPDKVKHLKKLFLQLNKNVAMRLDLQLDSEEQLSACAARIEPIDEQLQKRVQLLQEKIQQDTKRLMELRTQVPAAIEALLAENTITDLSLPAHLDVTNLRAVEFPSKGDYDTLKRVSKNITNEIQTLKDILPSRAKAVHNLRTFFLEKESAPLSSIEQIMQVPDDQMQRTSPKATPSHSLAARFRTKPY